jgi:hypothetical protein
VTKLKSISIDDCKVYRNWKDAPDGAFLQVKRNTAEDAIVVLKCKLSIDRKVPLPSIVTLDDGPRFCFWEGLSSDAAALDVSEHFKLYVENPVLSSMTYSEVVGTVFAHDGGALFVLVGRGEMRAYLCVRPSDEFALGIVYDQIDPTNIFTVGTVNFKPVDPSSLSH